MDKNLKERWVKALRSGKYEQARGCLRDDSGYCCLGVLLDVCGEGEWDGVCYTHFDCDVTADGDLGKLATPLLGDKMDEEGNLIRLNDGDDKKGLIPQSFQVIADYIEANL